MPSWIPHKGILSMTSSSGNCLEAVHWELVPSVGLGKPFPSALAGSGSWPHVTHQSEQKPLALGDRGVGLQPQRGPRLAVFFKLTLYSDLFSQTSSNAPGEWLELENEEGG